MVIDLIWVFPVVAALVAIVGIIAHYQQRRNWAEKTSYEDHVGICPYFEWDAKPKPASQLYRILYLICIPAYLLYVSGMVSKYSKLLDSFILLIISFVSFFASTALMSWNYQLAEDGLYRSALGLFGRKKKPILLFKWGQIKFIRLLRNGFEWSAQRGSGRVKCDNNLDTVIKLMEERGITIMP
jgi:hypothetical protein